MKTALKISGITAIYKAFSHLTGNRSQMEEIDRWLAISTVIK
jgi:hypothetical protein